MAVVPQDLPSPTDANASATSASVSLTASILNITASDNNTELLVSVAISTASVVTISSVTVTWNSVSMTAVPSGTITGNDGAEALWTGLFTLQNPGTGAHSIVVSATLSASAQWTVYATGMTFKGCDISAPVTGGNTVSQTSNASTSLAQTTINNGYTFWGFNDRGGVSGGYTSTNNTQLFVDTSGAVGNAAACYTAGTGGSITGTGNFAGTTVFNHIVVVNLNPIAVSTIEQPLFDVAPLLRTASGAREFAQGPFAGKSPAISGNFFTQPLFDTIQPRQPILYAQDNAVPAPVAKLPFTASLFEPTIKLKTPERLVEAPPGTSPQISSPYITTGLFDPIRLRPLTVDNPPILFQPPAVVANIVEQSLFDPIRLLKLPERFSELYPQRYWTPQLYQALFEIVPELKVPLGGEWTSTGAIQLNTVRYALTELFSVVKLKQPLVETPLVNYFPFVQSTPAQYRLLVPHYVSNGYYITGTIVTEGIEIPFGWPPTIAVEPLNQPAIQAYWNQGPKPLTDSEAYRDFYPFFQIYHRSIYWLPTGIQGQFQLTGAGASLGPRT